ncbi:MAG: aldose epimerase [Gemmatimonadota bacterium]
MTDDTESELHFGEWAAVTSSHGASLRGLTWRGQPVVTGYRGAAAKQGGQGDVLLPFPGRVKAGRYAWDGVEHQLPLTDKEGPNAIHGFVRGVAWQTESQAADAVTYRLDFAGAEGYPFPLGIRLEYRLAEDGLVVTCEISNAGATDAPVGVGFHPYFTVGSPVVDGDVLELPFGEVLEFEQLVPTGEVTWVSETELDFRVARPIADTRFNHCFAAPARDATGRAIVTLRGGDRTVRVWMDDAFGHVVVYSGDALPAGVARTSIAIEPMTCATDALNHPNWGLIRLSPGETRVARWGVGVTSTP